MRASGSNFQVPHAGDHDAGQICPNTVGWNTLTFGAATKKGSGWKRHTSFSMLGNMAKWSLSQLDTNCVIGSSSIRRSLGDKPLARSTRKPSSEGVERERIIGFCMLKLTCQFAISYGIAELVKFCIPLTIRAGSYLAPSTHLFQHCI